MSERNTGERVKRQPSLRAKPQHVELGKSHDPRVEVRPTDMYGGDLLQSEPAACPLWLGVVALGVAVLALGIAIVGVRLDSLQRPAATERVYVQQSGACVTEAPAGVCGNTKQVKVVCGTNQVCTCCQPEERATCQPGTWTCYGQGR